MYNNSKNIVNSVILHWNRYKERIKEKYLTKNPAGKEKIIDPKQWMFIKDGLDDFRDGIPPPCENVFIKVN
jgi:hypothetical protein